MIAPARICVLSRRALSDIVGRMTRRKFARVARQSIRLLVMAPLVLGLVWPRFCICSMFSACQCSCGSPSSTFGSAGCGCCCCGKTGKQHSCCGESAKRLGTRCKSCGCCCGGLAQRDSATLSRGQLPPLKRLCDATAAYPLPSSEIATQVSRLHRVGSGALFLPPATLRSQCICLQI